MPYTGRPRTYAVPPIDRVLAKTLCDVQTKCWLWQGSKSRGYGAIRVGRRPNIRTETVHRIAYLALVGPIPDGQELHHICERRDCVNPDHLQALDRRTHLVQLSPTNEAYKNARKTHCPKGHPLTPDNLVPSVAKRGLRNCRTCKRILCNGYRDRRAARIASSETVRIGRPV